MGIQRIFFTTAINPIRCQFWAAICGLLATQPAFACMEKDHDWANPYYFIAFALVLGLALTLTLLAWSIKKKFFPKLNILALHIATGVMGIALGLVGSFFVPFFEEVHANFAPVLPASTIGLLAMNHLLWLPGLFTIMIWLASRHSSKKAHYLVAALIAQILLLLWVMSALYGKIFV